VSSATLSRVRQAAAELGYRQRTRHRPPGPQRKRAPSRRSSHFALVTAGIPRIFLRAPVYLSLLQGVEAALSERGLPLVVRQVSDVRTATAPCLHRKVDGALLLGNPTHEFVRRALPGLICVQVMGVPEDAWWDSVTIDNQAVGRLAAERLLARGHRVCAVLAERNRGSFAPRVRAFGAMVAGAGGQVIECLDERLVVASEGVHYVDHQRMRAWALEMAARDPVPTGVFCVTDMLAAAAYPCLREAGLEPGRGLDVVSCNNEAPYLAGLYPRPDVVDIHAEDVGRRAVEQLMWRLGNPREPRMRIVVEPDLLVAGQPRKEP
jgi:LacI family transcriptional regulator